jgi:hypothetical protein
MAHSTDDQFNVQWDILQGLDDNAALLDPLSDLNNNNNEPAVLTSQSVTI